ncbi:hypothetical protein BHE74_00023387 [Ensete ventricosum]|uniref:Uncharacterized protein n=1 Tax=Ensete ventricosum TaxID=4639 RepID=A0A445MED3_ENSVE|nr:hypothetical protein BHE74_00023387 [Ensete ventricosum]RZR72558.1 hypothetical protein BHM03_00014538 [Ensete ventricosum]
MVDFDRHRLLSGSIGRFRPSTTDFGQYQPREGERTRGRRKTWCRQSVARSAHAIRRPGRVLLHTRGEETSPQVGRRNEATSDTGKGERGMKFGKKREYPKVEL